MINRSHTQRQECIFLADVFRSVTKAGEQKQVAGDEEQGTMVPIHQNPDVLQHLNYSFQWNDAVSDNTKITFGSILNANANLKVCGSDVWRATASSFMFLMKGEDKTSIGCRMLCCCVLYKAKILQKQRRSTQQGGAAGIDLIN